MKTNIQDVRRRPPGFEAIINNQLLWSVLQSDSIVEYAGHEENPRELPRTTLHDFKKTLILNQKTLREKWHTPDALYFVFANNRYSWEVRQAITVPKDHFWWLIDTFDTVLLSDNITHHYTQILSVNRDNDRVYFSDPWPEMFFLRKGLNAKGIEADDNLSVSRNEFLRVIVGLVTLAVPNLLEQYLQVFPEQQEQYDVLRRCGLMFLDDDRDRFAQNAAIYLTKSLNIAKQSMPDADQVAIASEAYMAHKITSYHHLHFPLAAKPYQAQIEMLVKTYAKDSLHAHLGAEDIGRIAYTAGNAKQFDEAKALFSEAINKDPENAYNHMLFASVCLHIGDSKGAIKYACSSETLNNNDREKVKALIKAADTRDYYGIEHLKTKLLGIEQKWVSSIVVRFKAYLLTKDYYLANLDADAVLEKQGDSTLGFVLKAEVAELLGDVETAIRALEKATSLELDTSKLNFYLAKKEELKRMKSVK